MNIIEPKLNAYINEILPPRDSVLLEMEEYARENKFPIIGPQVGTFLSQLVRISGAKNIFEMGSGYGYSAYWFAQGTNDSGSIICTEGSVENKTRALYYLKRGGHDHVVDFRVGDARQIIKEFDGPFDIILNDIDKEQYPEAFDLALPRLRSGGIFISDNVLWSGRIVDGDQSESTKGILEFNRKLFNSRELLASIIPIRDGLGMAVKL